MGGVASERKDFSNEGGRTIKKKHPPLKPQKKQKEVLSSSTPRKERGKRGRYYIKKKQ